MAKKGSPQSTGANRRAQLKAQQAAAAKAKRLNRIIIGGVGVLAVALIAVFAVILVQQFATSDTGDAAPPSATQDRSGVIAYKDRAKPGVPKVEVFFDYQCGGCATFEIAFGGELTKLAAAGDIDLIYRPMVFQDAHGGDASKRSATAATCADYQGKFNEYHNALFPLQRTGYPDEELLNTIPQQIGMTGQSLSDFQQCYRERKTLNFVKGTEEQAGRAGVRSTPTVWVNGKTMAMELLDYQNPSGIKAVIDSTAAAAR